MIRGDASRTELTTETTVDARRTADIIRGTVLSDSCARDSLGQCAQCDSRESLEESAHNARRGRRILRTNEDGGLNCDRRSLTCPRRHGSPVDDGRHRVTENFYTSGEYLEHIPDWHAEDGPIKARWIADLLGRNDVVPEHIVEIGMGSGEILVNLCDTFPSALLEGYDISPQAYAIAAGKASDQVRFHHADYLTSSTVSPDLIMAIDVFEHVEDYMAFLKAIRPLAPLKVFHIPLDLSVQGLLRGKPILYARELIGHLHYFFKDTALAVLADCGYEIVDWKYTHGAEVLPGTRRRLRTRMLNAPRRALRAINEDFAVRLLGGSSILVLTR